MPLSAGFCPGSASAKRLPGNDAPNVASDAPANDRFRKCRRFIRDRKTVAFTRLYGFCAAKFSKTATNFVPHPWQIARRKAVTSFLTRFGTGHRGLLFDRRRCFDFRRDSAQVFAKSGQNGTLALQST